MMMLVVVNIDGYDQHLTYCLSVGDAYLNVKIF
jgi:hypothetical protein